MPARMHGMVYRGGIRTCAVRFAWLVFSLQVFSFSSKHSQSVDLTGDIHQRDSVTTSLAHSHHGCPVLHQAMEELPKAWHEEKYQDYGGFVEDPSFDLPTQFTVVKACPQCANPFWMASPTHDMMLRYLQRGRIVSFYILAYGVWDRRETQVVEAILSHSCRSVRGGMLMVDIGMNTGYFSAMALAAGCRVVAFEPNSEPVSYMFLTVALNHWMSMFTLYENLVGEEEKDVQFTGFNAVSPGFRDNEGKPTTTVKAIRPDSIVKEDVLYMKIDVEGYEPQAFRGIKQLLENYVVHFILWEDSPTLYSKEDADHPPAEYLKSLGYTVYPAPFGGAGNCVAMHPKADASLRDIVAGLPEEVPLTNLPSTYFSKNL